MHGFIVYRLGRDPYKVERGVQFSLDPLLFKKLKPKDVNMDIVEAFGRTTNVAFSHGVVRGLDVLDLSPENIENSIKKKKLIIPSKSFDIVIDYRPKLKQLNIYIADKKWSKKLAKSFKKTSDFKSMVVLIGSMPVLNAVHEVRIGAFGVSSSELVKAVIKYKKK